MSKWWKKHHKNVCMWLIWLIVGVAIFVGARKYDQSFYFPDETDHVAVGYMMSHHDKDLYAELSTNHQPLPILMGATLTKFLDFDNFYELLSRLRVAMFLFWFIGGSFLILRFKTVGLIISSLVGLVGQSYFLFLLLPEATVFVGVAFLFLTLAEKMLKLNLKPRWWPAWLDLVLWGIAAFYLPFNLLTTAPFVLICFGLYLFFAKPKIKEIALMLTSGLLCLIVLFLLVNPFAWWQETVYNLINYWLPHYTTTVTNYIVLFFYPFVSAFYNPITYNSAFFWQIWVVLFIWGVGWLLKKGDKKNVGKIAILYVLIFFLTGRPIEPNAVYWEGFHLLPYAVGAISLLTILWAKLKITIKKSRLKYVVWFLWIGLFVACSFWIFKDKDRQTEYEVGILPMQDLVNTMNHLKNENDTLFTGPNGHGYLNMLTDLPFAGRQNFHLQWAWLSPQLRGEFYELFAHNPPTFIYFIEDESGYNHELMTNILPENYVRLNGYENSQTNLYMLRTKAHIATQEQWQNYANSGFTVPAEILEKYEIRPYER